MRKAKTRQLKPYSKPAFRKLTAAGALSRLTRIAAARGRDLLSLVIGQERDEEALCTGQEWIGVDLDGTLAEYDKWQGLEHIGEPIPIMASRVKRWLSLGRTVKIVTARVSRQVGNDRAFAEAVIRRWTKKYFECELQVTSEKDFDLMVLYDDRAVSVRKNNGTAVRWQDAGDFDTDIVLASPIDAHLRRNENKAPKN